MENIYEIYKKKSEDHTPYQEKINAVMDIERDVIKRLYQQGHDLQSIKTALFSYSPLLRWQGTKTDWDIFNKILNEEQIFQTGTSTENLTEESIIAAYDNVNFSRLMTICAETDKKVINELCNEGFSKNDVIEAFKRQNTFAPFAMNLRNKDLYKLKVENDVELNRNIRAIDELDIAVSEFIRQQDVMIKKYTDCKNEEYTEYHEGRICTSLLLHNKFQPETVEEVLKEHSHYQGDDREEYIKNLVSKCLRVKQSYLGIRQMDITSPNIFENVHNSREAYQALAKNYMERHGISSLDYVDDLKILVELSDPELNIPEQYIREAFRTGSPVAIEPGRDTEEYINSLMSERTSVQKNIEINNEKAERMFRGEMDKYRRIAERKGGKETGAMAMRSHRCNILAIHTLIENHFSQKEIFNVIKKHFPGGNDGKNSAYIILDSINSIVKREKELTAPLSPMMPELRHLAGKKYSELTDIGNSSRLTPVELFKIALHEHFRLNPSWKIKLFDKTLNLLVVETLLTYFPDFDRMALAGVLKNTPCGMLSQDPLNKQNPHLTNRYENMLINEAESRIKEYQRFSEQEAAVKEEYSRQCGLSAQGVIKNLQTNNILTQYQHGQGALKMMIKGVPEPDIRMAIIQTVLIDNVGNMEPERFADDIIEKTKKTMERREEILNYQPPEQPETANDFYKTQLHNIFVKRGDIKPSVDIDVAKNMIIKSFEPSAIKDSIRQFSPVIVQPGRDSSYIDYVILNAKHYIDNEHKKLDELENLPLFNAVESRDPYLLYELGERKLKNMVDLPFSAKFDEIIARNMFAAGIEKDNIEKVFNEKSPLIGILSQNEARDYVNKIVDKVYAEFFENESEKDVQFEHDFDRIERTLDLIPPVNEDAT